MRSAIALLLLLAACSTSSGNIQHTVWVKMHRPYPLDPTNPTPWLVQGWEDAIGVGSGKTGTSRWNHVWNEATLYPWSLGPWTVGPSVRFFKTFGGNTTDDFAFDNETVGIGIGLHRANHSATPSETTIRLSGQRRTENGDNDRIAYHTEQTTSLARWSVTHVRWPSTGPVRELSLWADHSIDVSRDASATVETNGQHKTEFRLGALADLWHSPDRNLTLGIGLEYILAREERTGRRMAPLARVRVFQRWNATAWYSDIDDARGVSVFYRLWGNE